MSFMSFLVGLLALAFAGVALVGFFRWRARRATTGTEPMDAAPGDRGGRRGSCADMYSVVLGSFVLTGTRVVHERADRRRLDRDA